MAATATTPFTANQETPNKPDLHNGFNLFKQNITMLHGLVQDIQRALRKEAEAARDAVAKAAADAKARAAEAKKAAAAASEMNYKRAVEMLVTDIDYINHNLDSLEKSSVNVKRADVLLQFLMDATEKRTHEDFKMGTPNQIKLFQIIARLKLWVPTKPPEHYESKSKAAAKQEESPFVSSKDKNIAARQIVTGLFGLRCNQWGMDGLLRSYSQLTDPQKLCLLCFSAFECKVEKEADKEVKENEYMISKSLKIKKNILVHWWVAEDLIHLHRNSIAPRNPYTPTSNSHPPPNPPIVIPETVEETGERILKEFMDKGFIDPVIKGGRESSRVEMHPFVHSFVTALANRAGFFDFSSNDGKLTPSFGLSQRACLVKPPDRLSSCKVWKKYIEDRNKLKRFETVKTLFNVNEPIIDIKPEWFSRMKNLSILHLGNWRSEAAEHIEVEDTKFMDSLETMVKMRLFSLQGVSTVMKLSDSVCKLENLVILNLRECHNLEELPGEIGCLKSLTHLDITNCHLLTKLPKGISTLSKLEVLKGFVIYVQDGHREDEKRCFLCHWWRKDKRCGVHGELRGQIKEECTLKDLEKLKELRQLSIVVNVYEFPAKEEVQVLREMRKLRKLKISWEKSFNKVSAMEQESSEQESENPSERHEASSADGLREGKEEESETKLLDQIRKLKLWGFPKETAPEWLHPEQLKRLEKLCIKGGELERVPGDRDDCDSGAGKIQWESVRTLRLKDLTNLKSEMTWLEFKEMMFPNLEYLEKFGCGGQGNLPYFPCDKQGVWQK